MMETAESLRQKEYQRTTCRSTSLLSSSSSSFSSSLLSLSLSSLSFQKFAKVCKKDLFYLFLICLVCAIQSFRRADEVMAFLLPSRTVSTTTRNTTRTTTISTTIQNATNNKPAGAGSMMMTQQQVDVYNNNNNNNNSINNNININNINININKQNGNNNNNKKDEEEDEKDEDHHHQNQQIAIIHVGPHKTGSTALQASIFRSLKYERVLQEQDNFALFPFDQRSGKCFFPATPPKGEENKRQCWINDSELQHMKDVIQNATINHQHLIYSAEILEFTDRFNLTTLRDDFLLPKDTFEMRISVVYRRFYEWIISTHGHQYRKAVEHWDDWPSDKQTKQHKVQPLVYWLTDGVIQDRIQNRYTVQTYKTYQEYFPNTTYLINYHDNVVLKNDVIMTALVNVVTKASSSSSAAAAAVAAANAANNRTDNNNNNTSPNIHGNTRRMGDDYDFSNKESSLSWVESLIPNDFVTNFACHPKTHTPHFCAAKQQEAYEYALSAIQSAQQVPISTLISAAKEPSLLMSASSNTSNTTTNHPLTRHEEAERRLVVAAEEPLRSNVGETTFYDEIVMAAYSKGILPENVTQVIRRMKARYMVRRYVETNNLFQMDRPIADADAGGGDGGGPAPQQSSSLSNIPLICINDTLIDMLLEISLNVERELFPDFFASPQGETALRENFESYRHSTKVCSVDTEKLFEQYPSFYTFFSYDHFIQFA